MDDEVICFGPLIVGLDALNGFDKFFLSPVGTSVNGILGSSKKSREALEVVISTLPTLKHGVPGGIEIDATVLEPRFILCGAGGRLPATAARPTSSGTWSYWFNS